MQRSLGARERGHLLGDKPDQELSEEAPSSEAWRWRRRPGEEGRGGDDQGTVFSAVVRKMGNDMNFHNSHIHDSILIKTHESALTWLDVKSKSWSNK